MQAIALDGPKLLALMASGLVFSIVGFYIFFRTDPDGETKNMSVFGLKVRPAWAGAAFFLLGSVFIAAPVFLSGRSSETARSSDGSVVGHEHHAVAPSPVGSRGLRVADTSGGPMSTGPVDPYRLADIPVRRDLEPTNSDWRSGGVLNPGELASGKVAGNDWDGFILDTSNYQRKTVSLQVEIFGTGCHITFYDSEKQKMGLTQALSHGKNIYRLDVGDQNRIYSYLTCLGSVARRDYEIGFVIEKG